MDCRDCDHEWVTARTGKNYRFYCKKCAVYSYVGTAYDLLPDKFVSVFLTGKIASAEREGAERI